MGFWRPLTSVRFRHSTGPASLETRLGQRPRSSPRRGLHGCLHGVVQLDGWGCRFSSPSAPMMPSKCRGHRWGLEVSKLQTTNPPERGIFFIHPGSSEVRGDLKAPRGLQTATQFFFYRCTETVRLRSLQVLRVPADQINDSLRSLHSSRTSPHRLLPGGQLDGWLLGVPQRSGPMMPPN